ncbi:HNH endonuclease signature motif containing protein [Streptomyces olivaceoviridis]|uniref:HNH endonuclease signature motif containing protein n=1 Tax=Streptomyces olivaceoviridis TaxID=1921 RepID=UPI0036C213A0
MPRISATCSVVAIPGIFIVTMIKPGTLFIVTVNGVVMGKTPCSIDGCTRDRASKQGWCKMHHKRWQRHGDPTYERPTVCIVDSCDRPVFGHGWCKMHHRRWERHGDPLKTLIKTGEPVARLWSSVDRGAQQSCWLWTGSTQSNGYGYMKVNRKTVMVHRYVFETARGPIPETYTIDHVCHDPKRCDGGVDCPHRRCCNPDHLKAVPPGDNNTRDRCISRNGQKTHCKRGHAFTPDNTRIYKSGSRACRRCAAILAHERYLKRKKDQA